CCSNSACTTMNQQGFTLAQLTTVKHIAPDSEEGFWQARRFKQAETRRNRQALLYWHHTIFGIATTSDQRTDLITNPELTALHIARYNFTGQFQTGNIRGTSWWRVSACSLQDIRTVHARRQHLDQHLTRTCLWHGPLAHSQHFRLSKLGNFNSSHTYSLISRLFFQRGCKHKP